MHSGTDVGAGSISDDDGEALLSPGGRAVLLALLGQPTVGVLVPDLAGLLKWTLEQTAAIVTDVLMPARWVVVHGAPPLVRVEDWAAEWLDHRRSKDKLTWRPRRRLEIAAYPLTSDPPDNRPERTARAAAATEEIRRRAGQRPIRTDELEIVTLMETPPQGWRERHRDKCDCLACGEGKPQPDDGPPTATVPRPTGKCHACKGRRLPPHWECLLCGRGGRDHKLPPLPEVRKRVEDDPSRDEAPKKKGSKPTRRLKGGIG